MSRRGASLQRLLAPVPIASRAIKSTQWLSDPPVRVCREQILDCNFRCPPARNHGPRCSSPPHSAYTTIHVYEAAAPCTPSITLPRRRRIRHARFQNGTSGPPFFPDRTCTCVRMYYARTCVRVRVCVCGPERASAQVDVCMRGTTNFLMTATSQGRASSYSALHALQSALPSSSRWNLDYTRAREEAVRLSSSPWIFGITGLDEVCLGSEEVGS